MSARGVRPSTPPSKHEAVARKLFSRPTPPMQRTHNTPASGPLPSRDSNDPLEAAETAEEANQMTRGRSRHEESGATEVPSGAANTAALSTSLQLSKRGGVGGTHNSCSLQSRAPIFTLALRARERLPGQLTSPSRAERHARTSIGTTTAAHQGRPRGAARVPCKGLRVVASRTLSSRGRMAERLYSGGL